MSSKDELTTMRVKRRTAFAVNALVGLDDPKAVADDIIWRALQIAFPKEMEQIERLQQMSEEVRQKTQLTET